MITYLHVFAINARSSRGILRIGLTVFPCRLGKNGKRHLKREGDGASPIGTWKLQQLYYRPDKMLKPTAKFGARPLAKTDGWCDARAHGQYNRHVKLPFKASHEELWRDDKAYDIVVSTHHNQRPRIGGAGSAIFLHVTDFKRGTEGCIALSEKNLQIVLGRCRSHAALLIHA